MKLPSMFTDQIARIFGEQGMAWLGRLPEIVATCQSRWHLTDLRVAPGLSYNLIVFAESAAYGSVALKLGVHGADLRTEVQALSLLQGRGTCTCYEADLDLGALLLERVLPGTDLTCVEESRSRFEIAADLFASLPIPVGEEHGFPTYSGWISRAFKRARTEGRASAELLALVDTAERFFAEIDTPDRPSVLLHGDLHHMNVLLGSSGTWKVIDPKGVIGVPCMGAARFMQNEFGMRNPADRFERLGQMTKLFAERLGESQSVLAKCAFVEHVLATCWNVEEQAEPESLRQDFAAGNELLAFYSGLSS